MRGEGVASQASCPIEWKEIISILIAIQIFYPDHELIDLMLSVLTLQWQLIGRIDVVMKLEKSSPSFNHQFPFSLLCKITQLKNIHVERKAMDPLFCPQLNLALFVESHAPAGLHLYGDCLNITVAIILENILSSKHFTAICPGSLGMHNIRKGAAAYASCFWLP